MRRIRGTKWFRLLQTHAARIAKERHEPYPADPQTNAAIHAEAECQLNARLERAVRSGR